MSDLLDRLRRALAGRYEVERELGQGGMAVVFLARDLRLDRKVAIKVFRPEVAHALGPDRFLREIRTAARLNHPNILALHEAGEGEGLLFYVMPYVEGESLAERMTRQGQLPIDEALDIVRQVATALHHAHTQGIVHRDIKPGNILLANGVALVADFGIAQAADDTGESRITATGITIGTPAYMSPEQALGSRRLDGRSDLYSLACVLYEMLVGEPPFTGPSLQIIAARHTNERVPGIRTVRNTVPYPVEQAVMRALAKAPADRFATAAAFAAALAPERLTREAVASAERTSVWKRRAPWLAGGAGLVILVAALTLGPWARRERSDAGLPPDRIAILPFRTAGGDSTMVRLGNEVVERLAQRLPGEGGLTAVFPGAVRAALGGEPVTGTGLSERRALQLARETGAGTVLLGELWRAEGTLSLRATLHQVPSGAVVARTGDLNAPADSIGPLFDQLALRLLLLVSSEPVARHDRLAAASLPMLRTWLAGRRAFLRGQYAQAVQLYEQVLRTDSTFAPAVLGMVAAGVLLSNDSLILDRGTSLARAILPDLEPADRVWYEALVGPAWPAVPSFPEHIEARNLASQTEPDRPEVWFVLGEALFHYGPWTGAPDVLQRAAAAFRRAIEREPGYVPAIGHLIDLGASTGDVALIREMGPRYFALDSTSALADYYRWRVSVALGDERTVAGLRARMSRLDPATLERIVNVAQLDGVGLNDALAAAEALWSQSGERDATRWAFTKRRELALNRGRPAEAQTITVRRMANLPQRARDELSEVVDALFWEADTVRAAETVARLAPAVLRDPGSTDPTDQAHFDACTVGLWHAFRGDRAMVPRVIASLRRAANPLANLQTAYIHVCAELLEAQLAAVERRPDARRPLERLDSLMRNAPQAITWILAAANLTAARLWEQEGELGRALAATRRRVYITEVGEQRVLVAHSTFLREEGRLAALTGDRDGALRAWNRYLALRADPEPALRDEVARIREELGKLVGREVGQSAGRSGGPSRTSRAASPSSSRTTSFAASSSVSDGSIPPASSTSTCASRPLASSTARSASASTAPG